METIKSPTNNFSKSSYVKIGEQIHLTLGYMPWTLKWIQNPVSQASYNYLITRKLEIREIVDIKNRAWSSGRFNKPSERAKKILLKTRWGTYVKPGHYLIQTAFEAFKIEEVTDGMIDLYVKLRKGFPFKLNSDLFLTHKDTAIDKPNLDPLRIKIIDKSEFSEPSPEVDREEIKKEIINLVNQL